MSYGIRCGVHWFSITRYGGHIVTICVPMDQATRFDSRIEAESMLDELRERSPRPALFGAEVARIYGELANARQLKADSDMRHELAMEVA